MTPLSIRQRLIIYTLAPCVLTTLVLSTYYFYTMRNSELEGAEAKVITLMSQLKERIANLHTHSRDISYILESALTDNHIRAIAYYDGSMKLIYHAGAQMYPVKFAQVQLREQFSIINTQESLRIRLPLFFEPSRPDIKSWLEVEYSISSIQRDWYRSILITSLMILGIIAVFILCLWPISKLLLTNFQQLEQQISQLQEGDFQLEEPEPAPKEIQALFSNIHQLSLNLKETQQKNEADISQATSELQSMLRKMEKQNTELDNARQDALQASRVKSEFLANMSHEIRTPLNGIIGFINLLRKTDLVDNQKNYLNTIESSSKGLLTIINDVLDFSKMEAGKLTLDETEFSLRNLLDDVLSILGPETQRKGLELASLITPETPDFIHGDPMRLRQILTNLVSNAIKFTHQGSVQLNVALEPNQSDSWGWIIKFSVTDTGVGLTAQQQKRLFEAFSQADTSTARHYGGTGLGLVISKHLIQEMKGSIHLESVPNEGSTFWFTAQFGRCKNGDFSYPVLPNIKIAVCEPLAFTRKSIVHRLHSWDMEIREFSNLFELSVSERMFDVVLYGLKGFEPSPVEQEVIRSLRAKDVAIIALTMGSEPNHFRDLESLGIAKVLSKPIHFEHLADSLRTVTQLHLAPPVVPSTTKHDNYVLAVDDNLANLRLIELLLKQNGYEAITAQSGIEALTLLKKYPVSIILMDIQMPGMDGIETTQKIRAEACWSQLPIIALTAHALPAEKKNILKAGLDDYLSKPIDEQALMSTLDKWLKNAFSISEPKPSTKTVIPESLPLFDEKLCLKRSNQLRDLATDLLSGIRKELTEFEKSASSLFEEKETDELLRVTHRLHGSLKYSGFPCLEKEIGILETYLKTAESSEKLENQLNAVLSESQLVLELYETDALGSFSYATTPI